jgi:hypothetical protein
VNPARIKNAVGLVADLAEVVIVPLLRAIQRDEQPRVAEIFAAAGEKLKSAAARDAAEAAFEDRWGDRPATGSHATPPPGALEAEPPPADDGPPTRNLRSTPPPEGDDGA